MMSELHSSIRELVHNYVAVEDVSGVTAIVTDLVNMMPAGFDVKNIKSIESLVKMRCGLYHDQCEIIKLRCRLYYKECEVQLSKQSFLTKQPLKRILMVLHDAKEIPAATESTVLALKDKKERESLDDPDIIFDRSSADSTVFDCEMGELYYMTRFKFSKQLLDDAQLPRTTLRCNVEWLNRHLSGVISAKNLSTLEETFCELRTFMIYLVNRGNIQAVTSACLVRLFLTEAQNALNEEYRDTFYIESGTGVDPDGENLLSARINRLSTSLSCSAHCPCKRYRGNADYLLTRYSQLDTHPHIRGPANRSYLIVHAKSMGWERRTEGRTTEAAFAQGLFGLESMRQSIEEAYGADAEETKVHCAACLLFDFLACTILIQFTCSARVVYYAVTERTYSAEEAIKWLVFLLTATQAEVRQYSIDNCTVIDTTTSTGAAACSPPAFTNNTDERYALPNDDTDIVNEREVQTDYAGEFINNNSSKLEHNSTGSTDNLVQQASTSAVYERSPLVVECSAVPADVPADAVFQGLYDVCNKVTLTYEDREYTMKRFKCET